MHANSQPGGYSIGGQPWAPRLQFSTATRSVVRLLGYLWREAKSLLLAQWTLYFIQALVPGALIYISRLTVDAVTTLASGGGQDLRVAIWLVVAGLGLTVFSIVLGLAIGVLENYFQGVATRRLQALIFSKLGRLPLTFYEQPQSQNLLQRLGSSMGPRMVQASSALAKLAGAIVTLCSYLVILWTAHWAFPLGLLPVLLVAIALNLRWGQERFWLSRRQTEGQRELTYLGSLLTGAPAAKEVLLFGTGDYLAERWNGIATRVWAENLKLSWRQAAAKSGLLGFSTVISSVAILGLLALIVGGRLTLGGYVALSAAVSGSLSESTGIAFTISLIVESAIFVSDFFELLDYPEEPIAGGKKFPEPLHSEISVEGLTFAYPGSPALALCDVTFTVRPGERIAIVGENGAGKTTLVKCLIGLYQPGAGTVRYDGVDLGEIDRASLRANVTAVFQDFVRYALTARENVGFGNIAQIRQTEALDIAAARAGATRVIDQMPLGWETRLSLMWTGGYEPSYGQWQRLAVARAFMRDAQVIAMDEPTAALDPKAEAEVFEQLAAAMAGRTAFFVSHRLGTARAADRILVMKDGRLVEQGTHDSLMAMGGEYARMFRTQARWYQ